MAIVHEEKVDVAVVDIRMPPTYVDEGIVAAGLIRQQYPDTGVLVLSQHLEPGYAMRLLEQTRSRIGYLLKERVGRVEELTDAIRRTAAGECVVDRAVVEEYVARKRTENPLARLSPREHEILKLMAEGRSNQGICETLWLSPKTVETHTHNLFLKLGLNDAPHDNRRVLAVLAYLRTA
ncbi:MAG: response regulator transcription factor [Actinomycetota bacterium]|nr:response regulator transcription factor [Actinomycetota bacterium]